jgi:transposase-like protein
MSKRTRKHRKPEEKAALLKRHVIEKVPVSEICEQEQLQPSLLYGWLHQLMERAPAAFAAAPGTSSRERQLEEKVAALEAKLARKDAVIAEISEEYVQLKKELGEP